MKFATAVEFLKAELKGWLKDAALVRPDQEAIYMELFRRDIANVGVKDRFYPLGGAGNYSLLYLLARCIVELKPEVAVELGAGQSTMLLNDMRISGAWSGRRLTVEHDAGWIAEMSRDINDEGAPCRFVHSPLIEQTAAGRRIRGYDFTALEKTPINLLLVDGPPAYRRGERFSRLCALQIVERLDPSGFVMIIDDFERGGEIVLLEECMNRMDELGISFRKGGGAQGRKRQALLCGGNFVRAAYF
jgi:hypothetical protein